MSELLQRIPRFLVVVLLAAVAGGIAVSMLFAAKPVVLTVLVLVFALIGLSLIRDLEWLSFLTVAATIPIRLNMRLSDPVVNDRAESAMGFVISLTDCLIVVMLLAWSRRILFYDQPIRLYPRLTLPMAALLIWVVQAGWRAEEDPISALWMVLRYVECWALFLYLVNNVRPVRDYLRHFLATCGLLVFESSLGLGQGATGGFNFGMEVLGAPTKRSAEHTGSRIVGTLPTPNLFAGLLSILIAQPLVIFFSRNRVPKLLALGVVVMTAFALLGTKSRGVWLSSTIVFGYFLFALMRTRLRFLQAGFGILWIAVLVGSVALLTPGVLDRLTGDDRGSAESRTYMNQIATNMIEAKPWFGFGWDNYTLYFGQYDDTEILHSEAFPFIVHNGYLYVAAEYGLPALLLMLWVWFLILKRTLRWLPEGTSFVQMGAFLLPWISIGRAIQTPLYVNNPLNEIAIWYTLGLCVVFRELADFEAQERAEGKPDLLEQETA